MLRRMLQDPERQRQLGGGRLQEQREIDIESPETHPVFAQLGTRSLIEQLDVLGGRLAFQRPEAFENAESNSAPKACYVLRLRNLDQRLQALGDGIAGPAAEPLLDFVLVG